MGSKFYVVGNDRATRHGFYPQLDSYVSGYGNSWTGECDRDTGCMFAMRKIKDEKKEVTLDRRGKRKLGDSMMNVDEDDEEDADWVPEDEDEDEPLEYASDVEESDVEEVGDIEMEDVEDLERDASEREDFRRSWIQAMTARGTSDNPHSSCGTQDGLPTWFKGRLTIERVPIQDEFFPLFHSNNDDSAEDASDGSSSYDEFGEKNSHRPIERDLGYHVRQGHEVEHIAGPRCRYRSGYSGHRISVEEMRGCQVAQCLVRKPKGWKFEPLEDDENFEKEGGFFLSGLTDHMPSRDSSSPHVQPPRHGCDQPHAENAMWDDDQFEEYAMPFHPGCFEVYKRASMLKNGSIDVKGLTNWWTKDAKTQNSLRSSHPDVGECQAQWWDHHKGTEYLAANPLYVPKLRDILQSTISTAPNFSTRNGAFQALETPSTSAENDPFACLPAEIRIEILDILRSKDIASLRLASRTFTQLPISYFQNLIKRELPWLWEAWPTSNKPNHLGYSFWATVTASEAEAKLQSTQKEIAALNDYVNIVSGEMPELKPMLEEALPAAIQAVLDAHQQGVENDEDRKPFFLPPDRTDYYMLYVLVKRHWKELRGLRNRARIWKDCRRILRQIEGLGTKSGA